MREEVLTVGAKAYMFHSGTHDVQSAIRIGDVLTVYHDYPPDPLAATKQTGMVKVISTIGNYYFLDYVIEGGVQPGSLAMRHNRLHHHLPAQAEVGNRIAGA